MERSLKYPLLVLNNCCLQPSGLISIAGTAILLKPGIISGGPVTHDCPLSRSIGYFLEPIIMLAPFAKKPFRLTLRGITTDENDLSVNNYLPPTRDYDWNLRSNRQT